MTILVDLLRDCGIEGHANGDTHARFVCACGGASEIVDYGGDRPFWYFCPKCQPPTGKAFTADELRRELGGTVTPEEVASPARAMLLDPDLYARNDPGNARVLHLLHGHELRFVHHMGIWRYWDGRRWCDDRERIAYRMAIDSMQARKQLAADIIDPKTAEAEFTYAVRSQNHQKVLSLLESAAGMAEFGTVPDDYDRDSLLFNTLTGTIDLRTGEQRPHDPKDMISKIAPVHFDPNALCERWQQFLREVFADDMDLIDFLWRAVGYSMTASWDEQVLFLLHGTGNNGKTVLLQTLLALLGGDYACASEFAVFTLERQRQTAIRNDIARLHGRRLITMSEAAGGVRFNESVLKQLTGGDTVPARFLHKEFFEFTMVGRFWIACNHLPRVADTSVSFWRRIRLLCFPVDFTDREDHALETTLRAELSGILNWAIAGAHQYLKDGRLYAPPAVVSAVDQYRHDEDAIGAFLAEKTAEDSDAMVQASLLHKSYADWMKDAGESEKTILGLISFGKGMRQRGIEKQRNKITGRVCYLGLRLEDAQ
jgi:putative DNA primase/helicase